MESILAKIGQYTLMALANIGALVTLAWKTFLSVRDFHWGRTLHQASRLGVDSLLIVSTISLFYWDGYYFAISY